MFKLDGSLVFLNIDQDYLKALHDCCSEVFYKPTGYENKPYIGLLLSGDDNRKYIIPLTSAKIKHKTQKNVDGDRFLIYELEDQSNISKNSICVPIEGSSKVKHILSVIDVKKMIPVRDEVVSTVDLNPNPHDTTKDKRYKGLLSKEYNFCLTIIGKIIDRANKLYDNQKKSGKVAMFSCDFSALEQVCDTYIIDKVFTAMEVDA